MSNERLISVKPQVLEKALRDAGLIRFDTDSHVAELRALLDAPVPCVHEWTDDGGHLLVCTACGAQEDHDPGWRDMATAPTDGTMVRLLVEFEEHSTEDAERAPTIGANNFDNDDEDVWRFAGWCWSHDHFTEGKGTPVGWLPMLDGPKLSAGAGHPDLIAPTNPFAERVIRKLERFQECADDGQGADIGRHWFDLLTQLGLLNRVQRSPALWEMTQQGEDALQLSRQSAKSR